MLRALLLFIALAPAAAWAQAYPQKPIRWILGYPPGGGTDVVARILSEPLSAERAPGASSSWHRLVMTVNSDRTCLECLGAHSSVITACTSQSCLDGWLKRCWSRRLSFRRSGFQTFSSWASSL